MKHAAIIGLLIISFIGCKEDIVQPVKTVELKIVNPTDGQTVQDSFKIEAQLSNYDFSAKVEFFVNGITSVNLVDSVPPYIIKYIIPPSEISDSFIIKAKAYLSAKKIVYSDSVIVNQYKILPVNGLSVEHISSTSMKLYWFDNSTAETSYRVRRKTLNGNFRVAAELGANATEFIDNNLNPDSVYIYQIETVSGQANNALSDSITVVLMTADIQLVEQAVQLSYSPKNIKYLETTDRLAVIGNTKDINIFDSNLNVVNTFSVADFAPNDIEYDNLNNYLFISYYTRGVAKIDFNNPDSFSVVYTNFWINDIDNSEKLSQFVIGGTSNKVELFDSRSMTKIREFQTGNDIALSLYINSVRDELVIGSSNAMEILSFPGGQELGYLPFLKEEILQINYSAKHNLYMCGNIGSLFLIDAEKISVVDALDIAKRKLSDIELGEAGNAVILANGTMELYYINNLQLVNSYKIENVSDIEMDYKHNRIYFVTDTEIGSLKYSLKWVGIK